MLSMLFNPRPDRTREHRRPHTSDPDGRFTTLTLGGPSRRIVLWVARLLALQCLFFFVSNGEPVDIFDRLASVVLLAINEI